MPHSLGISPAPEKLIKQIRDAKISTIMWMVGTNVGIGLGIVGLIIAAISVIIKSRL